MIFGPTATDQSSSWSSINVSEILLNPVRSEFEAYNKLQQIHVQSTDTVSSQSNNNNKSLPSTKAIESMNERDMYDYAESEMDNELLTTHAAVPPSVDLLLYFRVLGDCKGTHQFIRDQNHVQTQRVKRRHNVEYDYCRNSSSGSNLTTSLTKRMKTAVGRHIPYYKDQESVLNILSESGNSGHSSSNGYEYISSSGTASGTASASSDPYRPYEEMFDSTALVAISVLFEEIMVDEIQRFKSMYSAKNTKKTRSTERKEGGPHTCFTLEKLKVEIYLQLQGVELNVLNVSNVSLALQNRLEVCIIQVQ